MGDADGGGDDDEKNEFWISRVRKNNAGGARSGTGKFGAPRFE